MTKVYIAAPYPERPRAARLQDRLEAEGFEITARWVRHDDTLSDADARKDLVDIARADVLLALNAPEWAQAGTGGRHVELGYALALGLPIVLLGARSNIFHYLADVVLLEDDATLADRLREVVLQARLFRPPITTAVVIQLAVAEFRRASAKHPPMQSAHEGYAVLLEEVDELWAEIKADRGRTHAALLEAIQVAAMGMRYVADLTPYVSVVKTGAA